MTNDARFQRLKILIGEENSLKLSAATVAVFGIGGVFLFAVGYLILFNKEKLREQKFQPFNFSKDNDNDK
ncbi:MAG: hypothetical protein IJT73_06770 [Selenomonadaceae bacterium]|nr:hypothetical protein [Selenomonadaceae bacterium]